MRTSAEQGAAVGTIDRCRNQNIVYKERTARIHRENAYTVHPRFRCRIVNVVCNTIHKRNVFDDCIVTHIAENAAERVLESAYGVSSAVKRAVEPCQIGCMPAGTDAPHTLSGKSSLFACRHQIVGKHKISAVTIISRSPGVFTFRYFRITLQCCKFRVAGDNFCYDEYLHAIQCRIAVGDDERKRACRFIARIVGGKESRFRTVVVVVVGIGRRFKVYSRRRESIEELCLHTCIDDLCAETCCTVGFYVERGARFVHDLHCRRIHFDRTGRLKFAVGYRYGCAPFADKLICTRLADLNHLRIVRFPNDGKPYIIALRRAVNIALQRALPADGARKCGLADIHAADGAFEHRIAAFRNVPTFGQAAERRRGKVFLVIFGNRAVRSSFIPDDLSAFFLGCGGVDNVYIICRCSNRHPIDNCTDEIEIAQITVYNDIFQTSAVHISADDTVTVSLSRHTDKYIFKCCTAGGKRKHAASRFGECCIDYSHIFHNGTTAEVAKYAA